MALFTCYVTRAVHLDTVSDQSTSLSFIRCLMRFVARRCLPRCFISDNGKTFKAVSKYLDAVFKDGSVQEHLTGLGVTWQFNVEQTPWWGGAFERMVRSTKLCLRKLIGRAHFYSTGRNWSRAHLLAIILHFWQRYRRPITPSHLIIIVEFWICQTI